ncbi:hypothetical protein [Adhaeretor mobilis]|uniref:Doubled CXXCH motif n=1 Tax=Adhaeretor mobilis TaxID=1930276 RepID=A0A517MV86_9BACT|nr:hypothetical protein [Adhaeretor mobilis]QDS98792.1 Doubled CXXCH motif [Adhaeretor mobilis]
MKPRIANFQTVLVAASLLVAAGLVAWAVRHALASDSPQDGGVPQRDSHQATSSGKAQPQATPHKFPVTIRKPSGPPRLDLGAVDSQGKPVTVACSTCHTTRPSNLAIRSPTDLKEFHQSMEFAHGNVSCLSCHNPEDYDSLRLADGRRVEFTEVMTLCAQCHGTQTRDYRHGAHGGMNGHWDLSRGPRVRNNCVDCHDPHAPSFPSMNPTFKPRDRFLEKADHVETEHHE